MQASRGLKGQSVGAVRPTLGYQLPAKYILHAFAPTAHDPTEEEHQLLVQCYRRALALASQRQFRTLVFPVLGSGEHGFPFALVASIALTEIQRYLDHDTILEYVMVTVYDDRG